jgi:pimeloyl-ACP methyl ester carboxylesterase
MELIMRALLALAASAAVLASTTFAATPAMEIEGPTALTATGPAGELKGFWRGPKGVQAPIVLFIPGSGPTDHDGNNPAGVAGSPYGKLMEALAREGIATVAVDKRGMFGSTIAGFDANKVTIADYAADMKAWIAEIRSETHVPCVWIAGHSEGSLVALVTAQDAEGVCGVISISGAGRRLSDVIREQIHSNPANPPEILAQTDTALEALTHGRTVEVSAFHPALQQLFYPAVQPFLISMFSYDPGELAGRYHGPLLIVQGATDIQVSVADAQRLAAGQPKATLKLIDGMNHVLRAAPADRAANLAAYADASAPVMPGLAADVANFIKAHR